MAITAHVETTSEHRLMLNALRQNWWLILLRGMCAIAAGMFIIFWPVLTLFTLVILYGAFLAADGILSLIAAIRGGSAAPRIWLAVVGILGCVGSLIAFAWPAMTAFILMIFLGCWAIATGAMQIIGAFKLRKEISHEWLLLGAGILSVVAGIIFVTQPGLAALALVLLVAVYAIFYGVLLTLLALRLRKQIPNMR